jgi:hypothetical protein
MLKILIFKKPMKPTKARYNMTEVSGQSLWSKMGCYLGTSSYVFPNVQ